MPRVRHLRNAPITEAIFDFRVKARPEFRGEEFAPLQPRLADDFPKMNQQREFKTPVELKMAEGKGSPSDIQDLGLKGYFFRSEDEKTIAQFRVDGFTLNRLKPYTDWGKLFPLAMKLWQLYSTTARPVVITRLAVRYINRIPLPPIPFVLETYLQSAPVVPPELPDHITSFLTRVTIRDPAIDIAAHIAQASEGDARGRRSAVIFDIDAFKEGEFAIDDPAIEETFNRLREFKNLIFFNSLTEEAVRKFE